MQLKNGKNAIFKFFYKNRVSARFKNRWHYLLNYNNGNNENNRIIHDGVNISAVYTTITNLRPFCAKCGICSSKSYALIFPNARVCFMHYQCSINAKFTQLETAPVRNYPYHTYHALNKQYIPCVKINYISRVHITILAGARSLKCVPRTSGEMAAIGGRRTPMMNETCN